MSDKASFQLAYDWLPEWLTSKSLAQKAHENNPGLGDKALVDAINNEPGKNENKRTGLLNLLICKLDLQGSDGKGRRDEQLLKAFKPGWQPKWGNDGEPPPFKEESLYDQTLIMHCCATILPEYDASSCSVEKHCQLNRLLVPLLKKIFDRPDVAWLAYERYYEGDHENPVANLYRELGTILRLQSKATKDREALLVELKNPTNQNQDRLANAIREEISRIIHADNGNKEAWPKSPDSKLSRLAQLTCLIRERDESKGGDPNKRQYTSYLAGIGYKRIEIIEDRYAPYELKWPPQDEGRFERFHQALELNYSEGHDSQFLQKFFSGDQSEAKSGAIWVQDGEITFFWLLEAIQRLNEKRDAVAVISSRAICGKENSDVRLVVGDNFQTFVTKHCMLFSGKAEALIPTRKFWALVNFLNRLVCSKSPVFESPRVERLAESLLQKLKEAKNQSECFAKLDEWQKDQKGNLQVDPRLKTFLLEAILRSEDPYPYTLFFLPLSFDVYHKATLPSAFLGGTFGGLEWDSFPSVTSRQNLHLYAIIDAIRPAIDEEVGRVMRKDRDAYIEKLDTDKLFKTIQPHLTSLSEIIKQAQNKIELIDSNLDTDWGGILKAEVSPVIQNLFITNRAFEFRDGSGNVQTFKGAHNFQEWNNDFVTKVFHYLFRAVIGDTKESWEHAEADPEAFKDHALLQNLWNYFKAAPVNGDKDIVAKSVMRLLKMLAVEAGQMDRGVYIVQIYTALGRTLHKDYSNYDVLSDGGIKNLIGIDETGIQSDSSNTYGLLADSKPSTFLKGLRNLVVALPELDGSDKLVGVSKIKVDVESDYCRISLLCSGSFDAKFQRLLFEHMTTRTPEYHDLRTAVSEIARTVGNPVFGGLKIASANEPFVISENMRGGTTISIYLSCEGKHQATKQQNNGTVTGGSLGEGVLDLSQMCYLEISRRDEGGYSTEYQRIDEWKRSRVARWEASEAKRNQVIFAHANDFFTNRTLGDKLGLAGWDEIRMFLNDPLRLILYSGGDVREQPGENGRYVQQMLENLPEWVRIKSNISHYDIREMIEEFSGIAQLSISEMIGKLEIKVAESEDWDDRRAEEIKRLYKQINKDPSLVMEWQDRLKRIKLSVKETYSERLKKLNDACRNDSEASWNIKTHEEKFRTAPDEFIQNVDKLKDLHDVAKRVRKTRPLPAT